MKIYSTEAIVNVGIIGHGASGKTSLVSMLLHNSKAVNRLGRVDQGTAVTDYDEEEIQRGFSIRSAIAYCDINNKRINIIDTPGYNIFLYDTKACLRVVDSALITVCGVNGVEIQTEKTWQFCKDYNLPRVFVINKLDRENSDFNKAVESIHKKLDRKAIPVQIPMGKESNFNGVIDLLKMKAYVYEKDMSGKFEVTDIPADLHA